MKEISPWSYRKKLSNYKDRRFKNVMNEDRNDKSPVDVKAPETLH